MELDQPFLQLILNVVMTTGATSLTLFCYLLKRENQRLNAELHLRNEQAPSLSTADAQQKIGGEARFAPVLNADAPTDIREFVKQRSQEWMSSGIVNVTTAPNMNVSEAAQNRNGR